MIEGGPAALFDDYEDRPPARKHRKRPCKIERPLLERLVKALKALRQRADEKHWEPDWNAYQEHQASGDALLEKGDVPAAFREYCRAMLPLTRALSARRQKEECSHRSGTRRADAGHRRASCQLAIP